MRLIEALATFLLIVPGLQAQGHPHTQHWSYEGETGPSHWGDLSPEFSVCKSGREQSPIDITDVLESNLPAIGFVYKPTPLRIVDNGHTVQVTYQPGSYMLFGGRRFD